MSEYAYIRVSSRDQNEDRQVNAMAELNIPSSRTYMDKQSGKDFNRPEYMKLAKKLKRGDVLYILSLDRLGRNYEEIQNQWRIITKEKGADIVVLDMPLLDTRQSKSLTGRFVADIVLQVLAFCAQNERENIRKRQEQGIAAAKARGVHFGRTEKPLPENFASVLASCERREVTQTEAARLCNMPLSTFCYRAKKEMAKQDLKPEVFGA